MYHYNVYYHKIITGFIVITKSNLQIQEPLCQFVILEIETSGFFCA